MWHSYSIFAALCALALAQNPNASPSKDETILKKDAGEGHFLPPPPYGFPMPFPPPFPHPMPPPFPHPPHFPCIPPHCVPPFFPPVPPPFIPPPPVDRNICTLDATVLVVTGRPKFPPPPFVGDSNREKREAKDKDPSVGIMPPCLPGHPHHGCGNTVRIRCAETAVADVLTCTSCCQLASKFHGVRREEIRGVLIDSDQIIKKDFHFVGANRQKRMIPFMEHMPKPASCAMFDVPCQKMQCMCCGPRLVPPFIPPVFFPPPPPPFFPEPIVPLPQPVPFGPYFQPPPFPYPNLPFQQPLELFPITGESNQQVSPQEVEKK